MDAYKRTLLSCPKRRAGESFFNFLFLADDFEGTFAKIYSKLKGCSTLLKHRININWAGVNATLHSKDKIK